MRFVVLAFAVLVTSLTLLGAGRGHAQSAETLADIRQELNLLYVDVQRLRRELSTTGSAGSNMSGTSVLDRIGVIETELQRLTEKTEQLEHRVNRVVTDGTNRIGDLEFRLVELEGGDVSKLGQTTTLGGDIKPADGGNSTAVPAPTPTPPSSELAVGEEADFNAASSALDAGNHAQAADLFVRFNQSYPGSPMAQQADFKRGKALDGLGDTREAARAYLASFTGLPTGPVASEALFELGAALGRLGQTSQACVTLSEVSVRFPGSQSVARAQQEMAGLGCS